MTVSEFKAWLDGFMDAVDGAPTPEQWRKVVAKAGELQEPVYIPAPVYPQWPTAPLPEWPPIIWCAPSTGDPLPSPPGTGDPVYDPTRITC